MDGPSLLIIKTMETSRLKEMQRRLEGKLHYGMYAHPVHEKIPDPDPQDEAMYRAVSDELWCRNEASATMVANALIEGMQEKS